MAKNEVINLDLTDEELVELAEDLDLEVPDIASESNVNKLKADIIKHIQNNEEVSVEEYIKTWKNSSVVVESNEPITEPTTVALTKTEPKVETVVTTPLTFEELAKKANVELERKSTREAMKLVRVRISSNNVNKRNLKGEIFCVMNSVMEPIKKFVPYNYPTHIPQIMLDMLQEKMTQIFYDETNHNGRKIKKSREVPEYNIQILPPLTINEINAIKQKQLAEQAQIQQEL